MQYLYLSCLLAACVTPVLPAMAQESAPSPALPDPSATAPTDDTTPPAPGPTDDWVIRVDPMVWWVSPGGKIRLPSSGGASGDKVRVQNLDLDTPEFSPAGSVSINAGDLRFSFFGSAYSRDTESVSDSTFQIGDVSLAPGDDFRSKFDFNFFELNLGYRFLSYNFKEHSENKAEAADVNVDLYGIFGGRLYDMSISVGTPGGAASATDQFFGDVIAGVRAEFRFLHDFNINVQVTAGGMGDSDRTSYSIDVHAAGEWRPIPNVGVEFGWRQVAYSFEDGDGAAKFEYDGTMAGVFAGVVVEF